MQFSESCNKSPNQRWDIKWRKMIQRQALSLPAKWDLHLIQASATKIFRLSQTMSGHSFIQNWYVALYVYKCHSLRSFGWFRSVISSSDVYRPCSPTWWLNVKGSGCGRSCNCLSVCPHWMPGNATGVRISIDVETADSGWVMIEMRFSSWIQ